MRLTTFSDYSLRVLIYLGVNEGRVSTVGEIARAYAISENHLVKVVHHLAQRGYVATNRGKGGGMRLARAPEKINIGAVLRETEDTVFVECFDKSASTCRIEPACLLKGMLKSAVDAFFVDLERYTLADLLVTRPKLAKTLVVAAPRARRVNAG